jgi:hypothetical protein
MVGFYGYAFSFYVASHMGMASEPRGKMFRPRLFLVVFEKTRPVALAILVLSLPVP